MLNRDDEYLGRLRDYYAQHRVLPSFTAICRLLGLKSTSSVAAMARRMQETGHLESGDGGRLSRGRGFLIGIDPSSLYLPARQNLYPTPASMLSLSTGTSLMSLPGLS
jgi:hypothetical protein